jgi:DNA polymerase-3 subunit epsilon
MIILGLDLETTGLDANKDYITEVGAVLWDTELNSPIKIMGYLVKAPAEAFGEKVIQLTGITPYMSDKYGHDSERALRQLLSLYQQADYICAHNAQFDRKFLVGWIGKHNLDFDEDKLWIDTKTDLELSPDWSTKLTYLATEHGFINPFPHRAVFDVMTMLRILSKYDIDKVIDIAKSPTLTVKAIVSMEQRELAKTRGYHAQYENGKFIMWSMPIKECFLEREKQAAPFPIQILQNQ